MSGFLDKNTRVMDVILTQEGKKLLSQGKLHFVYYSFFDDEVDYDPILMDSGSMSMSELTSSKIDAIVEVPIMESMSGLIDGKNSVCLDMTNVKDVMFTVPQGQKIVPEFALDPTILSASIDVKQRKVVDVYSKVTRAGVVIEKIEYDRGYERFDESTENIITKIDDFLDRSVIDGCEVTVYLSGSPSFASHGFIEVNNKIDLDGNVAYDDELIIKFDNKK